MNTATIRNIPADPDDLNDDRAEWAQHALDQFAQLTGMDEGGGNEEDETVLGDLLADLMHWCDRHGVDFEAKLAGARANYAEETANEDACTVCGADASGGDGFGGLCHDCADKSDDDEAVAAWMRANDPNEPEPVQITESDRIEYAQYLHDHPFKLELVLGLEDTRAVLEDDAELSSCPTYMVKRFATADERAAYIAGLQDGVEESEFTSILSDDREPA